MHPAGIQGRLYPLRPVLCPSDPGPVRNGPTVYLFPQYDGAPEVVTIVESPTYDWAKALVEKYRPQESADAP